MIEANNPKHSSWVKVPENSHFPIQNLPFGIFSTEKKSIRVGVALGEEIIDLLALAKSGLLNDLKIDSQVFNNSKRYWSNNLLPPCIFR